MVFAQTHSDNILPSVALHYARRIKERIISGSTAASRAAMAASLHDAHPLNAADLLRRVQPASTAAGARNSVDVDGDELMNDHHQFAPSPLPASTLEMGESSSISMALTTSPPMPPPMPPPHSPSVVTANGQSTRSQRARLMPRARAAAHNAPLPVHHRESSPLHVPPASDR
jgi:hypothetical protein